MFVAGNEGPEFSGDEEDIPLGLKKGIKKSTGTPKKMDEKMLTEENSLTIGEIHVDDMTDEELGVALRKLGVEVGPIVGKKLFFDIVQDHV